MQRSHAHRVSKLAGKAGSGHRDMTTQDFVRLMDLLVLRDAPDYTAFPTDARRYTEACNAVAPGVRWPSHSEMTAILRRSDELLAGEQAAGRI